MKRILTTILTAIACVAIGFCGINNTLDQANSMFATAKTVADYQKVIRKYETAKYDVGYVAAEHDKAITEGIKRCNQRINELTPRLSVDGNSQSTSVSFGASGGSRSLSIATNQGTPYTSYVPDWITISSISSTGITISCKANTSTSSRSDWFSVNANSMSVRVNVSQSGAERVSGNDTYLKVDGKTAVTTSFSSSGGTETFTISTDASSWTTWGIPSFCEVTNRTATSFTLKCNANTSTSSRSDYMKIKTDKHEVRIDISQNGTSSSSSTSDKSASIEKVWIVQDVDVDGENGIAVHVKFNIQGMKGKKTHVSAYIYDSTNLNAIKDTNGRYCTKGDDPTVAQSTTVTPNYDNTNFNDAVVKIPYSELHQYGYSSVTLTVDVIIWDLSVSPSVQLTRKNNASFSFVPSSSVRSYSSSGSRTGKVNKVWVDYDQWQNNQKGMLIHVEFETVGCKDENLQVCAYFYTSSGTALKDYDGSYKTTDGNVSTHLDTTTSYHNSIWNDFKIFMPYDQLHMASGKHELKFYVSIYSPVAKKFLGDSDYVYFTFTK